MKSTRTWLSAITLTVCVACSGTQTTVDYVISGTMAADEMVYLTDVATQAHIDSVAASNGTFTLRGTATRDALLLLSRQSPSWQFPIFNDGTPVEVNFEAHTLKGSDVNSRTNALDIETSELINNYTDISREYMALPQEEQTARRGEFQSRASAAMDAITERYLRIAYENADNVVPVAFLGVMMRLFGGDNTQMTMLFDKKNAYMSHPYAQQLQTLYETQRAAAMADDQAGKPLVGTKFIDFEEPDVEGVMRKLSDYAGKGRWLLVDFWASWCGPCRAEMPNVVAAYNRFHDKGFDVLGVSFDESRAAWVRAIRELEMPWAHISDLKGWENAASSIYGIRGIPANLLIDPDGRIVARDLRGEALQQRLQAIFEK